MADVLENGVYQSARYAVCRRRCVQVASLAEKSSTAGTGRCFAKVRRRRRSIPLLLDVSLGSLGATVNNARIGVADPPPPAAASWRKPVRRRSAHDSPVRRSTRFSPANGRAARSRSGAVQHERIRLTNASDCGGNDCLWYVGYSYWRNINNHAGKNEMLILLGMDRNAGGAGRA
jgi:hypothetical protein